MPRPRLVPMGNCVFCGKRCEQWERNTDGTYMHTSCAMQTGVLSFSKKERS